MSDNGPLYRLWQWWGDWVPCDDRLSQLQDLLRDEIKRRIGGIQFEESTDV